MAHIWAIGLKGLITRLKIASAIGQKDADLSLQTSAKAEQDDAQLSQQAFARARQNDAHARMSVFARASPVSLCIAGSKENCDLRLIFYLLRKQEINEFLRPLNLYLYVYLQHKRLLLDLRQRP